MGTVMQREHECGQIAVDAKRTDDEQRDPGGCPVSAAGPGTTELVELPAEITHLLAADEAVCGAQVHHPGLPADGREDSPGLGGSVHNRPAYVHEAARWGAKVDAR